MQSTTSGKPPNRFGRLALIAMGMIALLCGVWGGLIRLPLNLPLPSSNANWISYHGPLMVCGFLGTVISLERAVGLRSLWTYAAPLLTGLGAVLLVAGQMGRPPLCLITAGSAVFVAVTGRVARLQRASFTVVMALAALVWLTGNVLWLTGWPIHQLVPWWMGFLGLTIFGERLELSRFQKPSRWASPLLHPALGVFSIGLALTFFTTATGERVVGAGLLAMAAWLGRFDIARRTVRRSGLTRFMAVCLLAGYFWMAVAGLLLLRFAPLESGLRYDAALHAFFLGFVFSMIFGHAPVIFPSVLVMQPRFHSRFYAHVALLHAALALRVVGDLLAWPPGRQWGGIGTAVAIGLFLLNTVTAFLFSVRPGVISEN